MATKFSGGELYVVCYQAMYSDLSVDLENLYTDKEEATKIAQSMSDPRFARYYVQTLSDAVDDLKRDAESRGRESVQRDEYDK